MAEQNGKVIAAFKASVAKQINNDRNHGWGAADSLAVIQDCVKAEMGKDLSVEAIFAISAVINPSQFRQTLEPTKTEKGLLNKSETGRKGSRASILAALKG